MRWSSAQPYRISNGEVNYAPFLLVPWAPTIRSSRSFRRLFFHVNEWFR